jgi:hypothetical protein
MTKHEIEALAKKWMSWHDTYSVGFFEHMLSAPITSCGTRLRVKSKYYATPIQEFETTLWDLYILLKEKSSEGVFRDRSWVRKRLDAWYNLCQQSLIETVDLWLKLYQGYDKPGHRATEAKKIVVWLFQNCDEPTNEEELVKIIDANLSDFIEYEYI